MFEATFPTSCFLPHYVEYDRIDGIHFDSSSPHLTRKLDYRSTSIEEVDWDTVPEEVIASILLEQLRAIAGARIDYETLLENMKKLSQEFS